MRDRRNEVVQEAVDLGEGVARPEIGRLDQLPDDARQPQLQKIESLAPSRAMAAARVTRSSRGASRRAMASARSGRRTVTRSGLPFGTAKPASTSLWFSRIREMPNARLALWIE